MLAASCVGSGATARGHGFLFVPADTGTATFVVAGHGTHPLGGGNVPPTEGWFKLSGGGTVDCLLAEAMGAQASADVEYEDGMTDEGVFVNMARCPEGTEAGGEGCTAPGD